MTKIINKKGIYQDKRERLVRETFINQAGKEKSILVSYFTPFVIVVGQFKNGDILMLQQYRHGIKREVLGFPAGFINKNEHYLKAAERELWEETGYKAHAIKLLGTLHENPARSRIPFYVCYASINDSRERVVNPDTNESEITIFRIPQKDIKSQKIESATVLACLYLLSKESELKAG